MARVCVSVWLSTPATKSVGSKEELRKTMWSSFLPIGHRCSLMNREPLCESMPRMGNGNNAVTCSRASKTHLAALFRTDLFTVHPVQMSVRVSVKQNSPKLLPPSISTSPVLRHPTCSGVEDLKDQRDPQRGPGLPGTSPGAGSPWSDPG